VLGVNPGPGAGGSQVLFSEMSVLSLTPEQAMNVSLHSGPSAFLVVGRQSGETSDFSGVGYSIF